jgi:di/tricarboxylate transporter
MSGQLNSLGVIKAFADNVGGILATLNMGWLPLFGLLHVVFFYLHYMFASQTAHVGALYSAFCAMMLSAGMWHTSSTGDIRNPIKLPACRASTALINPGCSFDTGLS